MGCLQEGAQAVSDAALSGPAKTFMDGADWILKQFVTSWLLGANPILGGNAEDWFASSTNVIIVLLVTLGLVIAGVRTIFAMRGAPFAAAAWGFGRVLLVVTLGSTLIQMLTTGGQLYGKWLIDNSAVGVDDFGFQSNLAPAIGIIFGPLLILAVAIQWLLMVLRALILPLLAVWWPVAAAGSMISEDGSGFAKISSWILAFILYVPVASGIYAFAWQMKSADGNELGSVINGMALVVLAVAALPALLRLIAPAANKVGSMSGMGAAAGIMSGMAAAGVAVGAAVVTGGASAAATGAGGGAAAAGGGGGAAAAGGGQAAGGGASSGAGEAAQGSGSEATSGAASDTGSGSGRHAAGGTADGGDTSVGSSGGGSTAGGASDGGSGGNGSSAAWTAADSAVSNNDDGTTAQGAFDE
jgi:hypothetical protein